jgi:hypothetical protein
MKKGICIIGAVMAALSVILYFSFGESYRWVSPPDFEKLQPFNARVDKIYISKSKTMGLIIAVHLRTADNDRIAFGGTDQGSEEEEFARSLKKGEKYEFPKEWINFKRKRKGEGSIPIEPVSK